MAKPIIPIIKPAVKPITKPTTKSSIKPSWIAVSNAFSKRRMILLALLHYKK